MVNERLIFPACNIYTILAEYGLHSCTFRWALWPMGLWFLPSFRKHLPSFIALHYMILFRWLVTLRIQGKSVGRVPFDTEYKRLLEWEKQSHFHFFLEYGSATVDLMLIQSAWLTTYQTILIHSIFHCLLKYRYFCYTQVCQIVSSGK